MKTIIEFLRPASIVGTLPNTIVNGQTIDATPLMADLNYIVNQVNANAAPLSNTALLDTANVFTAAQTGIAATAATHFPIASQIQNSSFLTLTSTLGTNTITARCAALTLSALTNGQIFTFVPSQTNTGAATLNPDGLGDTPIFTSGTNVMSGSIIQGVPMAVRYQSPNFHAVAGNVASGSWAPSLGGNTTYNAQLGSWRRIGDVVHIWFAFSVNAIGTGSTTTISGLPFANNSSFITPVTLGYFSFLAINVVWMTGVIAASGSTITFNYLASAASAPSTGGAIFQNSTSVNGYACYRV